MLDLHIVQELLRLVNLLHTMQELPPAIRNLINALIEPLLREREVLNQMEWRIQDLLGDWDAPLAETELLAEIEGGHPVPERLNGDLRRNHAEWIIGYLLQNSFLFAYFL